MGQPSNSHESLGRTDRRLIAAIRQRVEPPLVPDGPPLAQSEAATYLLRLADGVEEGYAAFYAQIPPEIVAVYGLKFAVGENSGEVTGASFLRRRVRPPTSNAVRVEIGTIVAWVAGDGGPCFQAIKAYVQSLAVSGAATPRPR